MIKQRTLKNTIRATGVGLHSGDKVYLTIHPAEPNTGIIFKRTDFKCPIFIKANLDNVVETSRGTTIGNSDVKIHTVEHILSALNALGLNTNHIKILLYQFVTLIREGEKVKMSTRKAIFVTLDYLLNELGIDIVRYFFIMRSMNTHLDFDLELAADQSDKNPVFYLQYAHARICNIIKHGQESGLELGDDFDSTLLSHPDEINLIQHMVRFPEIMELTFENLEPQIIANALQELATRFHKFYGLIKCYHFCCGHCACFIFLRK